MMSDTCSISAPSDAMYNPRTMTLDDYKELALALLDYSYDLTKEHMAMSEVLRSKPGLTNEYLSFLPQATHAVESAFHPLRSAIVSGSDLRPALEALLKLPSPAPGSSFH